MSMSMSCSCTHRPHSQPAFQSGHLTQVGTGISIAGACDCWRGAGGGGAGLHACARRRHARRGPARPSRGRSRRSTTCSVARGCASARPPCWRGQLYARWNSASLAHVSGFSHSCRGSRNAWLPARPDQVRPPTSRQMLWDPERTGAIANACDH
eukprot:COSAG02_NODE_13710_length_1358_cov_1.613185_2_plen_154_part_00